MTTTTIPAERPTVNRPKTPPIFPVTCLASFGCKHLHDVSAVAFRARFFRAEWSELNERQTRAER
jgi:hypothetical protein